MTVLTWSDERVEQLKKLWEAGLSASQIAAELGIGHKEYQEWLLELRGITIGSLTAIVLNLVFFHIGRSQQSASAPELAARRWLMKAELRRCR